MGAEKAPTGIAALDEALRGGLPIGRGYMITGGTFSDKEIFARHIQFSALERGNVGVYISFNKTYRRIIEEFLIRDQDVTRYLENDKFAIIDCRSLTLDYRHNIVATIPKNISRNIWLISDPLNFPQLFEADKVIKERIGFRAVTVVDSLSEQIIAANERNVPANLVIEHHRHCKDFFAGKGGIMGIHLFDNEIRREKYKEYNEFLDFMEDGTLLLEGVVTVGGIQNKTIHTRIKSLGIDIPKLSYEITSTGILAVESATETHIDRDPTSSKTSSVVIHNIGNFQGTIGDITNSSLIQQQKIDLQYEPDFGPLQRTLEQANVTSVDIQALKKALNCDPRPTEATALGSNVSSWIGTMLTKAAQGTWNIATDAAAKILTEAILKYYAI